VSDRIAPPPAQEDAQKDAQEDAVVFRDAEAFLAELGIERRPLVIKLPDDEEGGDRAPVSPAEAARIANELPVDEELVAAAVATIIRSTAAAPASEGRLRARLLERGYDEGVVEAAMRRARELRLVDDDALSAALVADWRSVGHAPRRIRDSLRKRGFDEPIIQRAVADVEQEDPFAVAFDLAVTRAKALAHLDPEVAYRRTVGFIARRGHSEGIARKAARDAVYDAREQDRTSGR
jgi:regulatory protein